MSFPLVYSYTTSLLPLSFSDTVPRRDRYRAISKSLERLSQIFSNLESSPRWVEARSRWPEGTEGPPLLAGAVRLTASHICALSRALLHSHRTNADTLLVLQLL